MLRSLLVNRTIQKPSGSWEVRVPTSGVGIQLRGQLQRFTPRRGEERGGHGGGEEAGKGQGKQRKSPCADAAA